MGKHDYQHTTNPEKIQYETVTDNTHNLKVVKDIPKKTRQAVKAERKSIFKTVATIAFVFALLLTISYRNSQINESFSEVQSLKKELTSIEKENEQLKVSIENSLNLNYIEQIAKEKLGMQKLTSKQTNYINLPKKDYTESASEKVEISKNNTIGNVIEKIFDQ